MRVPLSLFQKLAEETPRLELVANGVEKSSDTLVQGACLGGRSALYFLRGVTAVVGC